jgi:apolipoprotein D and lipocalin family protein
MGSREKAAAIAGGLALGVLGAAAVAWWRRRPPLDTVRTLDLQRYAGTWFEIARLPMRSEEGCHQVTARYHLRTDGTVTVVNRCVRRDGVDEVEGRAWRPNQSVPGSLRVRFFWPFKGDYNVLAREGYQYALVGSRNRKHAWILSRAPTMPLAVRARFELELRRQGFEVEKLVDTPQ